MIGVVLAREAMLEVFVRVIAHIDDSVWMLIIYDGSLYKAVAVSRSIMVKFATYFVERGWDT